MCWTVIRMPFTGSGCIKIIIHRSSDTITSTDLTHNVQKAVSTSIQMTFGAGRNFLSAEGHWHRWKSKRCQRKFVRLDRWPARWNFRDWYELERRTHHANTSQLNKLNGGTMLKATVKNASKPRIKRWRSKRRLKNDWNLFRGSNQVSVMISSQ